MVLLANHAVAECNNEVPRQTTPIQRFYSPAEGLVKDLKTGLMWRQCSEGLSGAQCDQGKPEQMSWAQAMSHEPKTGDIYDWRLPNVKELHSIIETHCAMPAVNEQVFPNTQSSYYWTSTNSALYAEEAWFVDFARGQTNDAHIKRLHYVRLVRTLRLSERTQ